MASDPLALPILLGLGFSRFSVPAAHLPFVQELVRRVSVSELRALADEVRVSPTGTDARSKIRSRLAPTLSELWREQGIE